jgi:hypothetical protein
MSTFGTEGSALRLPVAIQRLSKTVSDKNVNKRHVKLPDGERWIQVGRGETHLGCRSRGRYLDYLPPVIGDNV